MTDAEKKAFESGKEAFDTDKTIHDNPWATLSSQPCPLRQAWEDGYLYALDSSF